MALINILFSGGLVGDTQINPYLAWLRFLAISYYTTQALVAGQLTREQFATTSRPYFRSRLLPFSLWITLLLNGVIGLLLLILASFLFRRRLRESKTN